MPLSRIARIIAIVATFAIVACREHTVSDDDPDLIARVGDQRLMRSDVIGNVPAGITPADSAAIANAYIKGWLDRHVLSRMGARNIPDMTHIDMMVEEYRQRLIAEEYRRLMFAQRQSDLFPEDSLQAFFELHRADYTLQSPLVKGVYVRAVKGSKALPQIRRTYRSTDVKDIDRLEKQAVHGALHYDNFRDRWVRLEMLTASLPAEESKIAALLRAPTSCELQDSLNVHLIAIDEVLNVGDQAPYEYARESVVATMRDRSRMEFNTSLLLDLYNQGLEDKTIVVNVAL